MGLTLWLFVVDGRQANFSLGVTLFELAELMTQYDVDHGITLDGGGSSTLVARNETGEVKLLNAPYHTRFPMRERPVANHLGIREKSTTKAP